MTNDKFDKRVTTSLETINDKLEADQKADVSITVDTKIIRDFSVSFAKASISVNTNIKVGVYKYKDCDLQVSLNGNEFKAYGVYEKEIRTTGLGLAIKSAAQSLTKTIENHKISIIGEVQGDGIIAKIFKESENKSLLSSESSKEVSMYYSKLDQCFYVSEFSPVNDQIEVNKIIFISALI